MALFEFLLRLPCVRLLTLINLPLPVDGTHGAAAMLPITQFFAMRMKRRGGEMRLIIGGADAPPRKPDAALLKAIARAHRYDFPVAPPLRQPGAAAAAEPDCL